jgi:TonB family protein
MRRLLWTVPFVLLTASCAIGQEPNPSAVPSPADAKPAKVKVYTMGPGVTAPELLPSNQVPIPEEKCKKKENRTILLSTYIDATGVPCNVTLLYPVESEVDEMALKIVAADRFKPGTYNGAPAAVAEKVEVTLRTCFEEKTDTSGKKTAQIRLRSQPEQRFTPLKKSPIEAVLSPDAVMPPVQINFVPAEFSEEAKKAKFQGIAVVAIIVDSQGMPKNPCVVHSLGMGLDEKAIEAVMKYRFRPAMKDGKPVPVKVAIEINFRLY